MHYIERNVVPALLIVCFAFAGCGEFESPQQKRDAEAIALIVSVYERVVREQEAEHQRYLKEIERVGMDKWASPAVLTNGAAIRQARVSLSEFVRFYEQYIAKKEAEIQAFREEGVAMLAPFGKFWVTGMTKASDNTAREVYAHLSEGRQLTVRWAAEVAALFDFMEQQVTRTQLGPYDRIVFPTQADAERYNASISRIRALEEQLEGNAKKAAQKQSEVAKAMRELAAQVDAHSK